MVRPVTEAEAELEALREEYINTRNEFLRNQVDFWHYKYKMLVIYSRRHVIFMELYPTIYDKIHHGGANSKEF